jgi:hypothetical protein
MFYEILCLMKGIVMENQDCNITPLRRKRLEAQGYKGYSDSELHDLKFGNRFAYYLCGSLVILGLLLTNLKILGAAMIIAFFGSFPPYHPFDYLYNYVIRHWIGKPKLPPRPNQGRFACRIATVWLGGTIYLFYTGHDIWGYILGIALVFVATLVSTMDICIPSIIYNFLFKQKTEE